MKKLIITLLCAGMCGNILAQSNSSALPGAIIDFGVNSLSINDVSVNAWAKNYYNLDAKPGTGGYAEAFYLHSWDAGVRLAVNQPVVSADIEIGKRLTGPRSPIVSYLNLGVGDFNFGFDKFNLLNYKLTPDQQGQDMELQTDNAYFSITSRNYFNRLKVYLGKRHKASLRSGFYITEGWMPGGKHWDYGYYKEDGTDADGNITYTFNGGRVSGIPNISNFFTDVGVFVGIAF